MIRFIFSLFLLTAISLNTDAQYKHIIKRGSIEYELKVNRYERAKKLLGGNASASKYRDYILGLQNNRFFIRNYHMDFDTAYTSFRLTEKDASQDFIDLLIGIPTIEIFHNMVSDSIYVKKQFGEERFLVAERADEIKWKYTDERMDIMGYECRRANGLLLDSIYVVAFYCPEIEVIGGPSVIYGLPGMILGVSIPQEHVNIFATNVEPEPNGSNKQISRPLGGKSGRMTFSEFEDYLSSILRDRFELNQWEMTKRGIRF